MKISKEEILHIAELANIKIEDDEITEYIENLEDILNFANIVNKVSTQNIEVANNAIDKSNVFRKDEIKEFEDKESLLQNAPEKQDNMFKIPKVI